MKRIRRLGLMALLVGIVGIVGLIASCGPSAEGTGKPSAGPLSIECQLFYRPSMAERFSESTITLDVDNNRHVVAFDDLAVNAQYFEDQGEGQSLSISVTNLDTDREIVRQLYQIDREKGLVNQFIGGHGFTGLNYVFHPSSAGELQYFCQSR